ncbi:hypothetical protein RM572_26545 [Streptomyces sp. DSM 42041]|uniref:Uncharacterized protein n=1 Tax=Streptomyces hazeniae TaxID=3075538 RepID=A0ABU2P352_9ACTN|nr:hypothetical protein [Streptomyces sp. DSM 42041]MDT0382323.1 hypothetical protein [Streptomyces sp. DSM 42041]
MADGQITLAYSRNTGVVAIASGEEYTWAQTALTKAGFQRDEHGVYRLPGETHDAIRGTLADLVHIARVHDTSVTTCSRGFLGDTAGDIAGLLPGRWEAEIEIYAHPAWQGDLAAWLWDDGDLARAVRTTRITHVATLTNAAGDTLLLIDRPGPERGFLLGSLSPTGFDDGYQGRHCPRSVALPASPFHAAQVIVEQFLPAYERAVHDRQAEVEHQRADTPACPPVPVSSPNRQFGPPRH